MRSVLAIFLLFNFEAVACGKTIKEFYPFSIESNSQKNELTIYEIYSPVQKGAFFLSSVTARVDGEFDVNLDIREDFSYVGNYYRSYFTVAEHHAANVEIVMSYNTTKKDRSGMTFCGNWNVYTLTELLSFKKADKTPTLPYPPPPIKRQ